MNGDASSIESSNSETAARPNAYLDTAHEWNGEGSRALQMFYSQSGLRNRRD